MVPPCGPFNCSQEIVCEKLAELKNRNAERRKALIKYLLFEVEKVIFKTSASGERVD